MLLLAVIAVVCLGLVILGFVAPRWSAKPQRGLHQTLETADRKAGDDRSLSRRMAHRSTHLSEKAVDRATDAGREGRREAE